MKYICVQKKNQKGNVGHIVVLELKERFIESYRTNGQ